MNSSPRTTQEPDVAMSHDEAVELVELLSRVKNALHAHALGDPRFALRPASADSLRREIERFMRRGNQ